MAWTDAPPEVREFAEREPCDRCADPKRRNCGRCITPKELEVLKGYFAGYGRRSLSVALGIDPRSVKDRLESARRKLDRHFDQEDA